MRPIYIDLERDYRLLIQVLRVNADMPSLTNAMWWATAAAIVFAIGVQVAPRAMRSWFRNRKVENGGEQVAPLVSAAAAGWLIFLQLATVPIIVHLAVTAGRTIYKSDLGAYAYEAPRMLQAIHVFVVVVLLERFMRIRSAVNLALFAGSVILLLAFSWFMRDLSDFRGFYITGIMVAGIAVVHRLRRRVSYAWLVIPIIVAQPFFQYLGVQRNWKNEQLEQRDVVDDVFAKTSLAGAYWKFYASHGGDMNIFDTFVAASQARPRFYPYAVSWLYVPVHFIPRAMWPSKPRQGKTQDLAFTHGAPYSPGIAGFFLLDGGYVWMLGSMFVLGFLVSLLDWYVYTMRSGYLQSCMLGIVTINAMYLSRFFLWQYFYQVLYGVVPCVILAWICSRSATRGGKAGSLPERSSTRLSRPTPTPAAANPVFRHAR